MDYKGIAPAETLRQFLAKARNTFQNTPLLQATQPSHSQCVPPFNGVHPMSNEIFEQCRPLPLVSAPPAQGLGQATPTVVGGPALSPEQVMQEMPSALRLYFRSSSTWMLVSGRNKTGARLAGWRRLAKNMDRSKTRRKSPARRSPGKCVGPYRDLAFRVPTGILHTQTEGVWQKDGIFKRKKEQPLKHTGSWAFL